MPESIINLANAMYSMKRQPQHEADDRLDAARALLGVSPSSLSPVTTSLPPPSARFEPTPILKAEGDEDSSNLRRDRCDSAGLEALAFLASTEQASLSSGAQRFYPGSDRFQLHGGEDSEVKIPSANAVSASSSDEDSMPPPPPRMGRMGPSRRRSVSNPEGMEKWAPKDSRRLHFVIPASILEEELAEASAAMKAKEERMLAEESIKESKEADEDEFLDQDELLRRARSRLLEDLSEVNLNGDKGVLVLPHSLDKYKEVYNKHGRIGIYTPAERAAIISRFHSKRSRRVWNKKIRYNCRKSLADRRMRVKGRFVKRSTEAEARLSPTSETPGVPLTIPEDSKSEEDTDMPDTSDPDAGFCPTDGQPFRRVRRYTIT